MAEIGRRLDSYPLFWGGYMKNLQWVSQWRNLFEFRTHQEVALFTEGLFRTFNMLVSLGIPTGRNCDRKWFPNFYHKSLSGNTLKHPGQCSVRDPGTAYTRDKQHCEPGHMKKQNGKLLPKAGFGFVPLRPRAWLRGARCPEGASTSARGGGVSGRP